MAKAKLTKTVVEGVSPAPADLYLWDSLLGRFGLRVTPAGARIYLVQYRAKAAPALPAKTRRITIGQHGQPWTIEKARDEARRLLAAVDLGRDPFAEREDDRQARQDAADAAARSAEASALRKRDTFKAVAERYIELRAKGNRSWAETERLIRHGPLTAWSARHIAEVRRSDVADLLDNIGKRSPAVSRATYAALRGLFAWCVERDLVQASPCEGLTAPARPKARDRVLADDELAMIWKAAEAVGYPYGPVVQLLMLTGQRRAEVSDLQWAELDLEAASWRIPAERTKNGKAHEVDLCPEALAILAALPRNGAYVFPRRGGGPLRGYSAYRRRLDDLIEAARAEGLTAEAAAELDPIQPWRLHDLRRTAATGMAAMNFPPHIVERVLNHVSNTQSGLVGVYQRHEYRAERKAASTAWGSRVAAIAEGRALPSNVVAMFA